MTHRAVSPGWTFSIGFLPTCLLLLGALSPATGQNTSPPSPPDAKPTTAEPSEESKRISLDDLRDPVDGQLDMSKMLDKRFGFVPIAIPITEPTVGFGLAGAAVFIKRAETEGAAGFARPNITAIGGAGTMNGTVALFGADIRQWKNDRIQTIVGFVSGSINLDFYGIRGEEQSTEANLSYNLKPIGGITQIRFRLAQTRFWAGVRYSIVSTKVGFNQADRPGVPLYDPESRIGGLTESVTYDSRDNLFTPRRGIFAEGSFGAFAPALGGTTTYQKAAGTVIGYIPLGKRVVLGARGDTACTYGDAPFYVRPFLMLRGAPVMRYQGYCIAQTEEELRWQFWKRWSAVGFGGVGAAFKSFGTVERATVIGTGGGGFRYELARRHGLHVGLDVAHGPGGPAVYVVFGNYWLRP